MDGGDPAMRRAGFCSSRRHSPLPECAQDHQARRWVEHSSARTRRLEGPVGPERCRTGATSCSGGLERPTSHAVRGLGPSNSTCTTSSRSSIRAGSGVPRGGIRVDREVGASRFSVGAARGCPSLGRADSHPGSLRRALPRQDVGPTPPRRSPSTCTTRPSSAIHADSGLP